MPERRVKRHSVTQPLDKPYRFVPLTQGQNAIVDAADFEWLSKWHWNAHWNKKTKSFYAEKDVRFDGVAAMHRTILGCTKGEGVDHRNGDTLDNRRENIRKCTTRQNSCNRSAQRNNTSGFKGVTWDKSTSKWRARIGEFRKHLGLFASPEEAARVYDAAAKEQFGEFAYLNFPGQVEVQVNGR